ncbi:MAG: HEAT repeat domain-containing protein [Planctomycetota bacterium]|jgi:hypothetical protein
MNKPTTKSALGLALLAALAVIAAGCGGGGGGGRTRTTTTSKRQVRRRQLLTSKIRMLERGEAPRGAKGGVATFLADLASGDMVKAWRAEEALANMGPVVASQVRAMFGSASPEARAAACRLAYRFKDTVAIPTMIDLLADESRLVRVEASVNLSGITGQDFNFRADALPADRLAAIERWEKWYLRTYGTGRRSRNGRR